ncbi:MAG TPA: hypothetical protein VF458_20195, partial [Ktedonobacteraceae bacterium]
FLSERAKKAAIKQLARSEQGASPRFSLLLGWAGGEEKDLATALPPQAARVDFYIALGQKRETYRRLVCYEIIGGKILFEGIEILC